MQTSTAAITMIFFCLPFHAILIFLANPTTSGTLPTTSYSALRDLMLSRNTAMMTTTPIVICW
jgi:hypothetical protein